MKFISHQNEILYDTRVCVLYFYTSSMMYFFNKKMLHLISEIETERKDISFIGIDLGWFNEFKQRFDLIQVPSIVILKNGEEIKKINGLIDTKTFKNIFSTL